MVSWIAETNLDAGVLFPAELYFTKLAFTDSIAQYILSEFGMLLPFRMIMSASGATARLLAMVMASSNDGRSCGLVIVMDATNMVRLRKGKSLFFPLDIYLGL